MFEERINKIISSNSEIDSADFEFLISNALKNPTSLKQFVDFLFTTNRKITLNEKRDFIFSLIQKNTFKNIDIKDTNEKTISLKVFSHNKFNFVELFVNLFFTKENRFMINHSNKKFNFLNQFDWIDLIYKKIRFNFLSKNNSFIFLNKSKIKNITNFIFKELYNFSDFVNKETIFLISVISNTYYVGCKKLMLFFDDKVLDGFKVDLAKLKKEIKFFSEILNCDIFFSNISLDSFNYFYGKEISIIKILKYINQVDNKEDKFWVDLANIISVVYAELENKNLYLSLAEIFPKFKGVSFKDDFDFFTNNSISKYVDVRKLKKKNMHIIKSPFSGKIDILKLKSNLIEIDENIDYEILIDDDSIKKYQNILKVISNDELNNKTLSLLGEKINDSKR